MSVRLNLALCRLFFTCRPLAVTAVVRALLAAGFTFFLAAATAHAADVTLVLADPHNDAAAVGGYYLYYWQRSWEKPVRLNIGKQTTYTLADLQAGQTYYVAVTAHDGNGGRESEFSNVVDTAGTVFAVNAGGPEYISSSGTLYEADTQFSGGRTFSTTTAIAGTADQVLYQSERFGDHSYAIPLVNGDYVVTLQFAEVYWREAGQRVFDVIIEGTEMVSNLDLVARVGPNTAYDVALPVRVTDGVLNISFRSNVDNAKVSAIKVTAQKSPAQPPANQLPVAANDTATTPEGTAVTIGVLENDTDPDNNPLTVTSVTPAANGTVVPAGTAVTYTPKANFHGSDTFTYTVSDGKGGTATGTVTVTVVPVNSAPVARNSALTTAEDTVASGTLSATDADGDALTYHLVTQGSKGTATLSNATAGAYTYKPKPNATGTDTVAFQVSDGTVNSAVATVTVTITPVNDAPVAAADTATTKEDMAVTIPVLANDTDVDGNTLTVASVTPAANGTAAPAGTAVTYTPKANFHGTDTFTYTVSDGSGGSAIGTVTITVTPVNDTPVAHNSTLTAKKTGASGTLGATDVDKDALTYSIVTKGSKGTVTLTNAATGVYTYTPQPKATGTDTFTFQASDGTAKSNVATVTVTITAGDAEKVVFAVNAGGPAYVDAAGTLYEADTQFSGGRTYSRTTPIAGTEDDVLYQSERFGDFAYTVPLPNGHYVVTLHFAEIYWTTAGQRVFDVEIEGTEVVSNLDLVATVGANDGL